MVRVGIAGTRAEDTPYGGIPLPLCPACVAYQEHLVDHSMTRSAGPFGSDPAGLLVFACS